MAKSVLLVEYDESTISAIKTLLALPSLGIHVVSDGDSALAHLKKNPVDLVITAAMLPRFHGFKLCQDVISLYPGTPVIIISAIYKGLQYRHMALTQYKAADFFEKPLDKEKFKKRVLDVIQVSETENPSVPDIQKPTVEKPTEISSPPPDTTKFPTKWEFPEGEIKVTSDDIFGDLIAKVDGETTTEVEIVLDDAGGDGKIITSSPVAKKEIESSPPVHPSIEEEKKAKPVEKQESKPQPPSPTTPAKSAPRIETMPPPNRPITAEAAPMPVEVKIDMDLPDLILDTPISEEPRIEKDKNRPITAHSVGQIPTGTTTKKPATSPPAAVDIADILKPPLRSKPVPARKDPTQNATAMLLNELENKVKTQKFDIPHASQSRKADLQFDLNALVNPVRKETAKPEKTMRQIEEDIMKKLDQTLSGLGFSGRISTPGRPHSESPKKEEKPFAFRSEAGPGTEPASRSEGKQQDDDWDYDILGLIARGGMAEIYKAKKRGHKGFEKIIAIKKILSGYGEDDKYIEMLIDEAKVAAQLSHPNIVHIYDLKKKDSFYFIVMEYVLGKDMRVIQKILQEKDLLIPIELASYIMIKVLEALNYAHSASDNEGKRLEIVHRDVSPPNILISYNGDVKLADFGISKASIKIHQTVSGALKGKLLYMSPEQASGDENIDSRSDLYSAGLILFELITGRKMFMDRSEMGILKKVQEGQVISPREYLKAIDEQLEKIIMKSLQKDRDKRYQSAADMINDLQDYLYKKFDYFPSAIHLSCFITDLFQEEIRKEGIKIEKRTLLERPKPRKLNEEPQKPMPSPVIPPPVPKPTVVSIPPPSAPVAQLKPFPKAEKPATPAPATFVSPPAPPPPLVEETDVQIQQPVKIIEINLDDDLPADTIPPDDDLIITITPQSDS